MTDNKRVDRGRQSQRIVASQLQALGLVHARSVEESLPGRDIVGAGRLYIEVKAKEKPVPGAWTRDNARKAAAASDAPDLHPFVIFRPRGYGESNVDDWPVFTRWADYVPLLRAAGLLTPGDVS